jgi:putative nucleotidyltransferase with HDIG domain
MPPPPNTANQPSADTELPAAALLQCAREAEQAGRLTEAETSLELAITRAEIEGDADAHAEALRRLAVVCHRTQDNERARMLVLSSEQVARSASNPVQAAEALNTLAGFDLEIGEFTAAAERLRDALRLGGASAPLRARIEQNLGIIANVKGDHAAALTHYERSLEAFESARDERGCAIAYNNLGLVTADQGDWDRADRFFLASRSAAEEIGDVHLRGLALLNRTEVLIARQNLSEALQHAQQALQVFDELGARLNKSNAYCTLGIIYREMGRAVLSESRLRAAIDFAVQEGSALEEAEASRELAMLFVQLGRNQDALRLMNNAHHLFGRLDARVDLVDVAGKMGDLERAYLAVVRRWGESIESADSYTHGHCERVADYAVAIAQTLGFDAPQQTTVQLGAYLHDVGKVRVPHEILNKPGTLTEAEFTIMKRHPVYGIDLLAAVDFPWDIKPMIRWHHEKRDGSGYPDRIGGDEIPLSAQIICAADVYDALTTTRSYRGAMDQDQAIAEMTRTRQYWHRDIFDALLGVVASPAI